MARENCTKQREKKTEKSPILSKLKFGNLIVWFLSSKFEITRTTNKHTSFTSTLNPHEMETPNAYQFTFIASLLHFGGVNSNFPMYYDRQQKMIAIKRDQ